MKTAIEIPTASLVYNRYGKASPKQDAVVEVRVYYQKKVKFMSTRIRLFPKEWKDGLVTNRVDAIILNKQLGQILTDVRKVIYDMYEEGYIDIDSIPSRLMEKRKPILSFYDFCTERAKIRKYGKADDTQERWDRFLRFLKDYGKIKSFYDLTENKVMELDKYLIKKNDMKAKSRWNNYHRFLNSFILDAQKENLVQVNPYDRVKIDHGNDCDGINKCLTLEEFHNLRIAKMPSKRLEKVRDLFVFHVYSCMSYNELKNFNPKEFKEIIGIQVLTGQRGKTNVDFTVPFIQPAIEILDKYKGKLPMLSNAKYNNYIKEAAAIAGINKHITTHWARHTGATLLLNAGVSMQVVSKVCGHSSTKMTEKIYAKLFPTSVVEAVKEVADKLV